MAVRLSALRAGIALLRFPQGTFLVLNSIRGWVNSDSICMRNWRPEALHAKNCDFSPATPWFWVLVWGLAILSWSVLMISCNSRHSSPKCSHWMQLLYCLMPCNFKITVQCNVYNWNQLKTVEIRASECFPINGYLHQNECKLVMEAFVYII
jgi:hypothetical protein